MQNPEIQSWLNQARAAGLSDVQIREQLTTRGWLPDQIGQVLNPATPTQTVPPKMPPAPAHQVPNEQPTASTPAIFPGPIALYRATFINYWPRMLYYVGYSVIAAITMAIVTGGFLFLAFYLAIGPVISGIETGSTNGMYVLIGGFIIGYLLLLALNTLIATWLWSVTSITAMTGDGQHHFFSIFTQAIRRVPHVLWTNLIVGYILSGITMLALPVILLGVAGIASLMNGLGSFLFFIIGGVGLFVAIFAWIGTYLIYAPFVAMVGNARGFKAIQQSQTLVRGMWWRTFGRVAAIVLPTFVITVLLETLFYFTRVPQTLSSLILAIINIVLITPVFITYTLGMYNTAAQYQQNTRPTAHTSAMSLLIVASLGWLLAIGAAVYYYNTNPLFRPTPIIDYGTSTMQQDFNSPLQTNTTFDGI